MSLKSLLKVGYVLNAATASMFCLRAFMVLTSTIWSFSNMRKLSSFRCGIVRIISSL